MSDTTTVTSKNGNPVTATSVTFAGGLTVTDPTTKAPMIGPVSYNPKNFAEAVVNSFQGLYGFKTDHPFDL